MTGSTDRIEKDIVIKAPRARVWRALTDAREFGTWFGGRSEGRDLHPRGEGQGEDHLSAVTST